MSTTLFSDAILLRFPSAAFPTEASVFAWCRANGYSNSRVEANAAGWNVFPVDGDSQVDTIWESGIQVFVKTPALAAAKVETQPDTKSMTTHSFGTSVLPTISRVATKASHGLPEAIDALVTSGKISISSAVDLAASVTEYNRNGRRPISYDLFQNGSSRDALVKAGLIDHTYTGMGAPAFTPAPWILAALAQKPASKAEHSRDLSTGLGRTQARIGLRR